jgi:hypothetical protein
LAAHAGTFLFVFPLVPAWLPMREHLFSCSRLFSIGCPCGNIPFFVEPGNIAQYSLVFRLFAQMFTLTVLKTNRLIAAHLFKKMICCLG